MSSLRLFFTGIGSRRLGTATSVYIPLKCAVHKISTQGSDSGVLLNISPEHTSCSSIFQLLAIDPWRGGLYFEGQLDDYIARSSQQDIVPQCILAFGRDALRPYGCGSLGGPRVVGRVGVVRGALAFGRDALRPYGCGSLGGPRVVGRVGVVRGALAFGRDALRPYGCGSLGGPRVVGRVGVVRGALAFGRDALRPYGCGSLGGPRVVGRVGRGPWCTRFWS